MFRTVSDNRDPLAEEILRLKLSSFRGLVAYDGEDDEGDEEDNGDGQGDDDNDGSSGTGDDASNKEDVKNPKRRDASREAAKYRTERNSLRKERDEMAQRLREIEDKDKSELEVTKRDLAEAKDRAAKAEARMLELERRDAFFSSGAANLFVDPSVAIGLLDLKDLEPNDEGSYDPKVVLERAEALAKSKPYLRASGGDDDGSSNKEPSGRPANGQRGKSKDVPADKLAKKFPALSGRV